jgi:exosortase/archaeosortase family protein
MGGLWLEKPALRGMLLALTIPVAVVVNSWRIFLTGFLVFFVDPSLGDGFMHYTEGWVLFIVAFLILGGMTWALGRGESWARVRFAREPLPTEAP